MTVGDNIFMNGAQYQAEIERLERDLQAKTEECERLHGRLEDNFCFDPTGKRVEVTPGSIPDGIECRDEKIKLMQEHIDCLRSSLERAEGALKQITKSPTACGKDIARAYFAEKDAAGKGEGK